MSFEELLRKFSTRSTLHGMAFLGASKSLLSRVFWLLIIIMGLILAVIGIDECVKGWEQNPVVTAVWQVPIESILFPSITICPIGGER